MPIAPAAKRKDEGQGGTFLFNRCGHDDCFLRKSGWVMANKMWGGRFAEGPSAIMGEINASISFDKRLFAEDIMGSKAHAQMLAKQGIISKV